jgi:Concanavalin A-like lectin/glucanases superfamily
MKLLQVCAWFLVGAFAYSAAYGQASWLTNGLAAYYPFNGNANDESGNGFNGNPGTAQLAPDRFGVPQAAYAFNGSDSYITFAAPPLTAVDDISMFCWVKPTKLPQWGIAVKLGYSDGNLPCNGYALGVGSTIAPYVGSNLLGESACISWLDGNYSFLSTNEWHQIGFIRTGGTNHYFVDGQLTASIATAQPSPPTHFTIGTHLGSDQNNAIFTGSIDDVRLYNRALPTNEIAMLYSAESRPALKVRKAVYLDFANLYPGASYQIQYSTDMNNWTNWEAPFQVTNLTWQSTNYWSVEEWGQLFFRLQKQ